MRCIKYFSFLITCFLFTSSSFATTYTFIGSGNWSNSVNWDANGIPPASLNAADVVIINGTGDCTMDANFTSVAGTLTVNSTKTLIINATLLSGTINNQGTTTLNIGFTLKSYGLFTNDGTLNIKGDYEIWGNMSNNGQITNDGNITLEVEMFYNYGQIDNNSTINLTGTAADFFNESGGIINNDGSLVIQILFTNKSGSTINNSTGSTITGNGIENHGSITNNGQLTLTGTNSVNDGAIMVNNGTCEIGFLIQEGTLTNNNTFSIGNIMFVQAGQQATTTTNNGTFHVALFVNSYNINLFINVNTVFNNNGTLNNNGITDIATSATLINIGTFNNISTGTLNNYGTFCNTGILDDDGTFNNNGILKGSGTVKANIVNPPSGHIAPGDSPGILSIDGDFTNQGNLDIELGGTTAGTDFDQLNVSGATVLGGTLNVTLINGFVPTGGHLFEFITNTSGVSGSFATVNCPADYTCQVISSANKVEVSLYPTCPSGDINLANQAAVNDFVTNYPNCTEISGKFTLGHLNNSTDINDVSGLSNLTTITGNYLIRNTQLTSLTGLHNISSADGINISFNEELTSLVGMENITHLNSRLYFYSNRKLTDLTGFDNLKTLDDDLWIDFQQEMTSFKGLESLESIGGFFYITTFPNLTDISALSNLTTVGEYVQIRLCEKLTDLTGLENIGSIGSNLTIWYNENLSECNIASVCNYLSAPNGSITINNNKAGCNNQQEVEDACNLTTWTGNGGNGLWNTSSNWNTNTIPGTINPIVLNLNQMVEIPSGYAANARNVSINGDADLQIQSGASLTLASNQAVSINHASSIVSGTGTINGHVNHTTGMLAPGNSPGTLTINGDYDNTGGTLEIEANGTTAGSEYDQLIVNGALTLDVSSTKVNITFGYVPTVGTQFDIIKANSLSGTISLGNITFSGGNVSSISISYTADNDVRITVAASLPVELIRFDANLHQGNTLLSWQTAVEQNNAYFEIEHATVPSNFKAIGRVTGQGNSTNLIDYTFLHQQPAAGIHYYRLKQVDHDGTTVYSGIQKVIKQSEKSIQLTPNPFSEQLTIKISDTSSFWQEIQLYDMQGRLVLEQVLTPEQNKHTIWTEALTNGVYFLKFTNETGKIQLEKVLKQ